MKLSSELSVNLGIRYDYVSPPESSLTYPAVSESNPYAPVNTVVPAYSDRNNLAPRIGFAFNPHEGIFADGKTVFHGGFGVFYDVDFTNIMINEAQGSPNAASTLIIQTGTPITNPAAQLATATATSGLYVRCVQSLSSRLVSPITYQYNLGLEREVPGQIKLTLNYVGARGEKLFANHQLNPFFNGARLNPARNAINIRDNGGDSNYNAAQVEVSRAFSRGASVPCCLYIPESTGRCASEVFALFSNVNTSYQANLQLLAQDYGESAWDRRHIASFEYVYTPPGFHSSNMATDFLFEALTRHWTISGTTQFSSGPFSDVQIDGVDTNNVAKNPVNDRPANRQL